MHGAVHDAAATRRLALPLATLLLTGCVHARDDDALEPNDDFAEATRLSPGDAIEGRANQGNPDVFVVAAGPDQSLVFALADLQYENCPAFRVHGPDGRELLGQDPSSNCSVPASETRQEPGVVLRELENGDREIEIPAAVEGDYFLTIIEGSEADNIAPFSWDYRVTAILGPAP